jgi:hypothetical protein
MPPARCRPQKPHGKAPGAMQQGIKVFWFFSSEKNKDSSFSEEKEAKRLLFIAWLAGVAGLR